MAATVVRNDPETPVDEEQELRIPVIGRERPAMRKHDRLTAAPVLVVNRHSFVVMVLLMARIFRSRCWARWQQSGMTKRRRIE